MLKSIKIRLYPSYEQENYINKLLGSSRFVYNILKVKILKILEMLKNNIYLKNNSNYNG